MTSAETMRRVLRAAGALTVLVGLLVGLPLALAHLAGNPLPSRLPDLESLLRALTARDDGTLFLRMLALVGWLAWASFTLSVGLETAGRLFARQTPEIPGLRAQRRLAAALIGVVLAAGAAPVLIGSHAAAYASPPATIATATATANTADPAQSARPAASPSTGHILHLVERGQALLDLQDRYGVPWQRIAEANHGTIQPDGQRFERGSTRIYPGWQLRIPTAAGGATASPVSESGTGSLAADEADGHLRSSDRDEVGSLRYAVSEGDWLWHVADRYLGDPNRYAEIAALNPQYAHRGSSDGRLNFPDYLEPGWQLTLPPDATDGGVRSHATGTHQGGAAAAPQQPVQPPDGAEGTPDGLDTPPPTEPREPLQPIPLPPPPAMPTSPPAPAVTAPGPTPPSASASAAASADRGATPTPSAIPTPTPTPTPTPAAASQPASDAVGAAAETIDRLAPRALAGAGLLAALVVGAVLHHRRRRNQDHTEDTMQSPASTRLDRTLRAAQQPLDTARLDAALHALATGLTERDGVLPDVAGALVEDGVVQLLLRAPCPDPPAPWRSDGDRWTLPADQSLPAPGNTLAPVPTLTAVGSQAGKHVLLDLERLGVLTLHGDPGHVDRLLRYLAAELTLNTWSDNVDVLLSGFGADDANMITSLNPGRVRLVPSVSDGVRRLRRRMAAAQATQRHSGASDAFAGRVLGLAGDGWMPSVLLAATPSDDELAELAGLQQELATAGRCAVAVVTASNPGRAAPVGARVTVNQGGVVHVRLPFLRGCLAAAGLTRDELADMAEALRHARVAPPVPVPPAAEPQTWAAGTTATGAVRSEDDPDPPVAALPRPAGDPALDDDLSAWYAADPGRPRISVLGPVVVDSHGTPPERRLRLHAELIVYLAQRGALGADAAKLDAALWPDTDISETDRQLIIARARQWLGTDLAGNPWLSDAGPDLSYRLSEGHLLDWHLFRRLRTRGEMRGAGGASDLRAALRLVRGIPFEGADRPAGPGARNPYPWLADSHVNPEMLVPAVVDVAHQLAEVCLAAGDTDGVRWAARQAWLADPARSYDQPWRDLMRAEQAAGHHQRLRRLLAELMEARDAEAVDDLSAETLHLVRSWSPSVLATAS